MLTKLFSATLQGGEAIEVEVEVNAGQRGKRAVVLPAANAREAAFVSGIDVFGPTSLRETWEFLTRKRELTPVVADPSTLLGVGDEPGGPDFSEVQGQHAVRRAIEVGVSGNHALFMVGANSPGLATLV